MRKRQEMGLNQLRTKRSGVRVPPGAPRRGEPLWFAAFFCAKCGFTVRVAAPPRKKSRSARLLGCKRPRLRLTVATNFSRLKGIVLWVSISSPQPSGKLPLPRRGEPLWFVAFFCAKCGFTVRVAAPLREKSRSARLLGCKRPRLRLAVATNFSRLKGIVLWASILSPQPSGKLPLLSAKSLAAPALFACKRAHDVPACYQLFADFPTFPQPGTGRARRPACSFFSSLLPPDPYLTHTVFPWVWVKLWSGYHRISAPGIFLAAPSVPAPHPFSWLPPAGRWW